MVWPVLLEQVLGLSVGFTDKWLAGNLLEGAEYLAAVGLVAYCLSFLPGLFAVPAVAATALVSRSVGACDLRPVRADWLPDTVWLGRILHVGIPAGVDSIANASCHLAFLSIVNSFGDVAAAAHSVAITIESLAFLPGSAFMVVAATLAGQFLGARDERRARRSVWLAAMACMTLMSAAGIVFLATADGLAAWFVGGGSRQPEVAGLTAQLVRIVAFAQPPLALLMVFSGGLRGAGATRVPLAVNFLGMLLVRLPLAVFLARESIVLPAGLGTVPGLGLAAIGAWYAMAADLTVRGMAMLLIFSRRFWSRAAV